MKKLSIGTADEGNQYSDEKCIKKEQLPDMGEKIC